MFQDRLDAAARLAEALAHHHGEHPLVLAIPRGGVPMAQRIARELDGDLDVVLVHKLGAPGNPEYAIGAVSEDGAVELPEAARTRYGADYVDAEIDDQLARLRERRRRYTPVRPPIDPADRVVIVVDDGSATGATMQSALRAVRQRGPRRLVAALGVAPPEVVGTLKGLADEVLCLHAPRLFYAVGQFYSEFGQVSDDEVVTALSAGNESGQPDAGR